MRISDNLGKGKIFAYFLLSYVLVFSSCQQKQKEQLPAPSTAQPAPQPASPNDCITRASAANGNAIEGQYIVQYKKDDNIALNHIPAMSKRLGVAPEKITHIYHGSFKAYLAKLTQDQLEQLKQDPAVNSVEPDRIASIQACYTEVSTQSIPWGITRVGYGDGSGKTVWIIDTGIDLDHPDLNVDVSHSKSFISASPDDDHGHGTHVAGIIAAKNNHVGVVGVAANASVVALKVMDSKGNGSISKILTAVNYVISNGKAGDVVNMSVGGGTSSILDQAVKDAADKGILFALSAGNDATDAATQSPARVNHSNVFTVSAINSNDIFAGFSNYGPCVDYAAPGVNITSTFKEGGYATMSGTSMATPHVAGLLVLKGTNITADGFAKDDPDGTPDPIAHK